MNRDLDLDPREDDKENSSQPGGKRLHHEKRRSPSSALKEDSLTTILLFHENGKNGAVVSAKISLSPSLTVDCTKTGILIERRKGNVPFLDLNPSKLTISNTTSSSSNTSKQITDGAFTTLGVGSNDATEGILQDERNEKVTNALSAPTTQLRRSRRLRKRPSRFDAEFDGLGSLPKPEARVKRSDDDKDKEDPPAPALAQELEVLLNTNSTPLPFCDPLSSIYSFGAIGDHKQDSVCYDSDKSVSLADVFCPEGVFRSVNLLSQLDLNLHEDQGDSKSSKHASLSDTVYERQKIADMKLPAYCRMLNKIAHNSESPDQAHNILRVTIQQYLDCIGTLRPNGVCFNAVIHGYAQLGYAAAAENVLSLMFQDYFNYHNALAKPNVRVYTNVLHAWRKSKSLDAHERCEKILEEMHRLSDTGVAPECKPDAYAYTVLFHCLAESDCADASEVAERQYKKMKQGSKMVQIDAIAYSNLLNIFTKNPSTHKRAEHLLWEMVLDYKGGNKKAKPHTRNFNTVLAMWAKSNDPESARRAQLVVERLIQFQDEGTLHVKPDEYTYSLLLKNWVSRGRCGIDHAVNCLHWMEERYRRGDKAAKLDIIKYTTCISALAKEGLPHRAECLLKKMEYDHRNGNKSARPDAKNFEMIISSWSGFYDTHHAVNEMRAEKLLQMMWTLGQQPAFAHIRPGVLAYTRVMEAMAKKNNPERSEKLLNEMVTFHKLGRLPAGPDVHTYHVAIDAWANSNRQEGLLRAGQLRTQMNRQLGLEK